MKKLLCNFLHAKTAASKGRRTENQIGALRKMFSSLWMMRSFYHIQNLF
jgi:hypothetical protein